MFLLCRPIGAFLLELRSEHTAQQMSTGTSAILQYVGGTWAMSCSCSWANYCSKEIIHLSGDKFSQNEHDTKLGHKYNRQQVNCTISKWYKSNWNPNKQEQLWYLWYPESSCWALCKVGSFLVQHQEKYQNKYNQIVKTRVQRCQKEAGRVVYSMYVNAAFAISFVVVW